MVLPEGNPSQYLLRTNPDLQRISTFEAICRVLGLFEGYAHHFQLEKTFTMFVERHLWLRGVRSKDTLTTPIPTDALKFYNARSLL